MTPKEQDAVSSLVASLSYLNPFLGILFSQVVAEMTPKECGAVSKLVNSQAPSTPLP